MHSLKSPLLLLLLSSLTMALACSEAPDVQPIPEPIGEPDVFVTDNALQQAYGDRDYDMQTAFVQVHEAVGYPILTLSENLETCNLGEDTEEEGFSAFISFPCGPITAGEFAIGGEDSDCSDGPYVQLALEGFTGEYSEYDAESGSVLVQQAGEQVIGYFIVKFDDAIDDGDLRDVIGTFVAESCQDVPVPNPSRVPPAILQDSVMPTTAAE
jgi:hypothetical protein